MPLAGPGGTGDVLEVELSNDSLADRTVEETAERLPDRCLVATVSRDETDRGLDSDFRLASSDHLPLVCETNEAMQSARRLCQNG